MLLSVNYLWRSRDRAKLHKFRGAPAAFTSFSAASINYVCRVLDHIELQVVVPPQRQNTETWSWMNELLLTVSASPSLHEIPAAPEGSTTHMLTCWLSLPSLEMTRGRHQAATTIQTSAPVIITPRSARLRRRREPTAPKIPAEAAR